MQQCASCSGVELWCCPFLHAVFRGKGVALSIDMGFGMPLPSIVMKGLLPSMKLNGLFVCDDSLLYRTETVLSFLTKASVGWNTETSCLKVKTDKARSFLSQYRLYLAYCFFKVF